MNQLFPKIEMDSFKKQSPKRLFLVVGVIIAIIVLGIGFSVTAPKLFINDTLVTIPEKVTTRQAGMILAENNIIRSKSLFELLVKMNPENKSVIAGEFVFDKKMNLLQVVQKITNGVFGKAQVKITIPEGSTNQEIARIIQKAIPEFNSDEFIAKTKLKEGYLFPETYFVFRTITPDSIITRLEKEYQERKSEFQPVLDSQSRNESQIITMASLLEKEAFTADEAKIISGILWKRFDQGMPLQVDAPFLYILGKTSSQLTKTDLQKDGPYNTYTRKGLPVGPIGNPGIDMIFAALKPQKTDFWYYLHDTHGKVYFAKTYQEHLQNKQKYLK